MLSKSWGRAAIRASPAAFEVYLEFLANSGSGRRWGIFCMALLQISRGAVWAVIRKIFTHLARSDMLREVDVVVVVVPGQIDQSIKVTMTHNAVPKRDFFSRGTGFHC